MRPISHLSSSWTLFCCSARIRRMLATGLLSLAVPFWMPAMAASPPLAELEAVSAQLRPAGQDTMRFLGLRIYDIRLWVGPNFRAEQFAQGPLALELTYFRDLSGEAIAERSVEEIERQTTLTEAQAQSWVQALTAWLPDVKKGDTLSSLYLPGQGMQLWRGAEPLGFLADPQLAELFFGIWLSPQTSEPDMRDLLLQTVSES